MLKEAETNGKTTRRRICKLPKKPILSDLKKAPKNLAIDFYDPVWFNQLQMGQKRLVANTGAVAFLPNAAQSLAPVRHPDEKLGDKVFTGKYRDIICEPYELSDDEDAFDDNEDESGSDTSIDLEAESDGAEDEDKESDAYSEGNYGDLYEDKDEVKDSDEVVVKSKGEMDTKEDEDDSEDEDWMAEEWAGGGLFYVLITEFRIICLPL